MVTASFINRLSQAVDRIERPEPAGRPWKVVRIRCGYREDRNAARDRHYAAHPEDRDADVVILHLCDDEGQPARAEIGLAGAVVSRAVSPDCYCSARQTVASPTSYSRASSAIVSPAGYRSATRLRRRGMLGRKYP